MTHTEALAPCTVALLSAGFLYLAPAAHATEAESIALSFEPPPASLASGDGLAFNLRPVTPEAPPEPPTPAPDQPLPIPSLAGDAPVGKGGDLAELPPPPEPMVPAPAVAIAPEILPPASPVTLEPQHLPPEALVAEAPPAPTFKPPELSFAVDPLPSIPEMVQNIAQALQPKPKPLALDGSVSSILDSLFSGGSDSLVAIAVGSAEGTRTPTGEMTSAYKGHTDPGNGVWNLGTFSYQHGASSPADADVRQLARLQKQATEIFQDAEQRGMSLSLAEKLNAIDLANQAPAAALSRGGYLDRLQEARQMGLTDWEAISWARTRSYIDPDTRQWNAPGLGNTVESITADQERRMMAIARAVEAWPSPTLQAHEDVEEQTVDQLLALDL